MKGKLPVIKLKKIIADENMSKFEETYGILELNISGAIYEAVPTQDFAILYVVDSPKSDILSQ